MIARILGGICVGLLALAGVQTFNLARSDHELTAVRVLLDQERVSRAQLQDQMDRSETNRELEAVAAARDRANAQTQCQAQIKTAQASARAIAEITDARCLDKTTTGGAPRGLIPADRLRDAAGQASSKR